MNQIPPDLTEIVRRSLNLIQEGNDNSDTSLPPAWTEEHVTISTGVT